MIIGNKMDSPDCTVTYSMVKSKSKKFNADFFEISASKSTNIEMVYDEIISTMNKSNNSQEQVNIKHFYINNSEIKVIMLGSSNSGKTSFINHLQNESINTEPTRSPKINKINLEIFSLSITDTAGQDRYRPIISPFIHNHHIFIIIFDITDRISFADIDNFYNLIFDNVAAHDFKIIIFGNKVDLSSDRNVTYEEAIEKANSMDADYLEISCKNGYNFGLAIQLIKNADEFVERKNIESKLNLSEYTQKEEGCSC